MNPIMLIIGTRPEGIKMAPIYFALKQASLPTIVCSTNQHTTLLTQVYQSFNFTPDVELHVMQHDQDLFHVTQDVLHKTKEVYRRHKPSLVLVQGDTTSAMAASLSAFYEKIPVGHVEAGLRTYNMHNPFPEEMNRRAISVLSSYHFAPTHEALQNLLAEKIDQENIFYTGNTIVDALRIMREKIQNKETAITSSLQQRVEEARTQKNHIVLLTTHRRESFHGGTQRILTAIKMFALNNPDVLFVYPYHPNPHILETIKLLDIYSSHNIVLTKPLLYQELVYILDHAAWVATDSGGIQEEALSLGKHVIVLRETTERPEGIVHGLSTLVGTDETKILAALTQAKKTVDSSVDRAQLKPQIYGDGYAAQKIVGIIQTIVHEKEEESHEPYLHHGPGLHRPSHRNRSR